MLRASICCLLLSACGAAVGGAPLRLALKETAPLDGPRVRLGALLEAPAAAPRALLEADLGAAPLPGYTLRLSKAEIVRRLRARSLGANVDWTGAPAVGIERLATPYDNDALVAAARAWLQDQLAPLADRIALQAAQRLPDIQLPAGAVELKPRPLQGQRALRPEMTVWIDIVVDGTPFRTVAVPFRVAAFRRVLVARHQLGAGTRPGCADLDLAEADAAPFDSAPLAPDCTRVAGQLKRSLAAGTPLLSSHMRVPAAVVQGEQVALRVAVGTIELETRALALMNGEVGQRIDVRASSSNSPVNAEVVAPGIVALTKR
jgi:flagella basal body P-ring formation protein FlgA